MAWGLDSTAGQLGDGGGNNTATPIVISLACRRHAKGDFRLTSSPPATNRLGREHLRLGLWPLAGELGDGAPAPLAPVVVSLPPGSTPESLGQEPGSAGGMPSSTSPSRAPYRHDRSNRPHRVCRTGRHFHGRGRWFPGPHRAVAGLHQRRCYLLTAIGCDQRHAERSGGDARRERKPVRGGVHQRDPPRTPRPTRPY